MIKDSLQISQKLTAENVFRIITKYGDKTESCFDIEKIKFLTFISPFNTAFINEPYMV